MNSITLTFTVTHLVKIAWKNEKVKSKEIVLKLR